MRQKSSRMTKVAARVKSMYFRKKRKVSHQNQGGKNISRKYIHCLTHLKYSLISKSLWINETKQLILYLHFGQTFMKEINRKNYCFLKFDKFASTNYTCRKLHFRGAVIYYEIFSKNFKSKWDFVKVAMPSVKMRNLKPT